MAASTAKSEIIQLRGVEMGLSRKGSGTPLFLLHGGGGPVAALPFADMLAKRFEIIAPIHPGFDGTRIPDHYDSIHDLAFTYLDLMDRLDLRDAVLMGFSMGGWLAAELAVMSCARFSKLVLVDAVGVKHGGPNDRDIADVFAMPAPQLTKIMWHDPAKAPDPSKMSDEQFEIMAANRIALALYTWEPFMHNPKLAGRLHRISVPTLVVWGESDQLVTPDYGRAYARLIPGASFVAIPRAGHAPQIEQPEAFVAAITEFTD